MEKTKRRRRADPKRAKVWIELRGAEEPKGRVVVVGADDLSVPATGDVQQEGG